MRACAALLAVGCVVLTAGCKNQRSTFYDVSEISVFFEVVTTPEKTVAKATFSVRGGDVFLFLGGRDEILVNEVPLVRQEGESYDYYTAEIPAEEGYTFVFKRRDASYEANVFAPEPLELTAPAPDARLSRAAGFNASWTGSQNDKVTVEVNGEGIVPFSRLELDTGGCVVGPGAVEAADPAAGELPAVLAVTRSNWSEALPPEMAGQVVARMRAEVPVVSVP